MHRIIRAIIPAITLIIAGHAGAAAQDVSLVGSWRSCEPGKGCGIVFSFFPDGRVIKQYLLLGSTVTNYGHYSNDGNGLRIAWTRVSPKRVCAQPANAGGGHGERCVTPTERNVAGPLAFDGFNALIWNISGGPRLRLERRED